jgi:uncharacterized protein YueI
MFSHVNTFIDTIQGAKTSTINNLITDKKMREPFQSFIDAQTAFAKEMAKISQSFYEHSVQQIERYTITK